MGSDIRGVSEALAIVYAVASAASFVAYGMDKAAARRGDPRVRESVLHLLALAGGWPGAWLGQRAFRHKTLKRPFRAVFWTTAIVNCAGAAALLWLSGRGWR